MRAQTRKYRTESRPDLDLPPAPETRVCRGATRNSSRNRLRRRYFPDTSSLTHRSVRPSTRRVACRRPYGDGPKACKFRTRTPAGRRHPLYTIIGSIPDTSSTMVDSGVTVSQDGKYVAIHERQADGSWKIVRDIWNANAAFEMAMDEEEE